MDRMRILSFIMSAIALCGNAWAEVAVPEPTGFLTDLTGTIPGASIGAVEITNKAISLSKDPYTNVVVMTLLVPTTEGEAISDFAQRVAEAWHPGSKLMERGVVLVIAKGDKTWAIKTTRNVSKTFTDYDAKHVLNQMKDYLKQNKGDFAGAVSLFYSEIPQYLKLLPEDVPAAQSVPPAEAVEQESSFPAWGFLLTGIGLLLGAAYLVNRALDKKDEEIKARLLREEAIRERIRRKSQERRHISSLGPQDPIGTPGLQRPTGHNPYSSSPNRVPSTASRPLVTPSNTEEHQLQTERERDRQRERERDRQRERDTDSGLDDFVTGIAVGLATRSIISSSRDSDSDSSSYRPSYSAPEPDRTSPSESYDGGGASGSFGD